MNIKDIYEKYNYPGADKLYKLSKKEGLKVTLADVTDFLKKQHVAQVFKKEIKKRGFIVAFNPEERVQMDLVDMTKFAQKNGGYGWIFLLIDIFTRKISAYMMKNKTENNIEEVLTQFLKKIHPDLIISDNESGFKGKIVQKLLEKNEVSHDMVEPQDHKALGIVDRAVQTIKNSIYKYMKDKNTTAYIKHLPSIIESYNDTPNMGLENIAPNEASEKENVQKLQIINHEKDIVNKKNYIPFHIGNTVRILLQKNAFARSFDDKYSDEIYTITEIGDRKATLNDGQRVSLRRLVRVVSDGPAKRNDVLTEAKKASKVKKAIAREHLEIDNKEFPEQAKSSKKLSRELQRLADFNAKGNTEKLGKRSRK